MTARYVLYCSHSQSNLKLYPSIESFLQVTSFRVAKWIALIILTDLRAQEALCLMDSERSSSSLVEDNNIRQRLFVRRGTALRRQGLFQLALDDYR